MINNQDGEPIERFIFVIDVTDTAVTQSTVVLDRTFRRVLIKLNMVDNVLGTPSNEGLS